MNIDRNITNFISDMGIDDMESIAFLYQDYVKECNELIDTVNSELNSIDLSSLKKKVHNLKGVSANLYVQPVADAALNLENHILSTTDSTVIKDNIITLWQDLENIYISTIKEISLFFSKNGQSIVID